MQEKAQGASEAPPPLSLSLALRQECDGGCGAVWLVRHEGKAKGVKVVEKVETLTYWKHDDPPAIDDDWHGTVLRRGCPE